MVDDRLPNTMTDRELDGTVKRRRGAKEKDWIGGVKEDARSFEGNWVVMAPGCDTWYTVSRCEWVEPLQSVGIFFHGTRQSQASISKI